MKRFMYVEIDRYDVLNTKVEILEGNDKWEVLEEVLRGFDLGVSEIEKEKNNWSENREGLIGLDSDEVSYFIKEVK